MNSLKKCFRNIDFSLSLFMLAVGVAVIAGTLVSIPAGRSQQYPLFVGGGLTVIAAINLLSVGIRTAGSEAAPRETKKPFFGWQKSLPFISGYAMGIYFLGFTITSWLVVFLLYNIIMKEKRNRVIMFVFPTVFTAFVYVVFALVFYVRLPVGVLPNLVMGLFR